MAGSGGWRREPAALLSMFLLRTTTLPAWQCAGDKRKWRVAAVACKRALTSNEARSEALPALNAGCHSLQAPCAGRDRPRRPCQRTAGAPLVVLATAQFARWSYCLRECVQPTTHLACDRLLRREAHSRKWFDKHSRVYTAARVCKPPGLRRSTCGRVLASEASAEAAPQPA